MGRRLDRLLVKAQEIEVHRQNADSFATKLFTQNPSAANSALSS